MFKIYVELE